MDSLKVDMQLAVARHLRWIPGNVEVTATSVSFDGWALSLWDRPDALRFLVNGKPVQHLNWPAPSPYLAEHFPDLPGVEAAHFFARYDLAPGEAMFPGGFLRLNITGPFGEHRRSYSTAWFYGDPALEPETPTDTRIARVIGVGDGPSFRLGGATIVNRLDALLRDRFDRSLAQAGRVLDWGCGAGRLTRYLTRYSDKVTGIDIDADNIAACRATIPSARFESVDLFPPTDFADESFDLILGLSVMTHLDPPAQDAWLGELRRLARPGGLVLLSITGATQLALYRDQPASLLTAYAQGIYLVKQNNQLEGMIPDATYYKDTLHSPDYIAAHWGKFFEVLDILPAIAGNQDLVLLRRPLESS